jgi:hypothetical protein
MENDFVPPFGPYYHYRCVPRVLPPPIAPWRLPSQSPFLEQQSQLSQPAGGVDPFVYVEPATIPPLLWHIDLSSQLQLIKTRSAALTKVLIAFAELLWNRLIRQPLQVTKDILDSMDWWMVGAVVVAIVLSPVTSGEKAMKPEIGVSGEELRYEMVRDVRRWGKSKFIGK